jgi:SAM-dependent MidA family methyltransferase
MQRVACFTNGYHHARGRTTSLRDVQRARGAVPAASARSERSEPRQSRAKALRPRAKKERAELTDGQPVRWREAMESALYGVNGFFLRAAPADHFRTSALASPAFAAAVLRLVDHVDNALGRPPRLDIVDVGAGRGELLGHLAALAPPDLRMRLRLVGVERVPRPPGLPEEIEWIDRLPPPRSVTGVLLATEWLDNVPVEVAELDAEGIQRYVMVDPLAGAEVLGETLSATDAEWLSRWSDGCHRLELGGPRDEAWARAVQALARGVAITVDYGHTRDNRPPLGTLTGFRNGREVAPVPDGSCDITAHVAIDAVAAAGEQVAGTLATLGTQRKALTALGLRAGRPPLSFASEDPAAYVRSLSEVSQIAELSATGGLGDHFWLMQPIGVTISPAIMF